MADWQRLSSTLPLVILLWYVALGSALGGVSRHLLSAAVQSRGPSTFPLGTLIVNVSGSLLLGFVLRYALGTGSMNAELRALLTTGFCGGFTTFSAFSYETASLMERGDYRRASVYVAASVALSLAGMFLGFAAARELMAARRPS